jgi:ABC-type Zn uptake system ZnuABC Zn-binding protein ZnuA
MLAALFLVGVSAPAEAAVKVVASTQDLASIAETIGGPEVSVSYIARGDLDPHFIDAKPSYMLKLASADLVIAVGMDLEVGWLPSLLTGSRNPKIQPGSPGYLDASATIKRIEVPTGTIDRSRGDLHPAGNPHYWLDPENGRLIARAVAARLGQLDPAHVSEFNANLATFESKLTTKEAEWASKMAPLKGTPVIAYHSTIDYFCNTYGLPIVGFVEPKPGIPPTPSHTLELSTTGKTAGVKLVLVELYHNAADANPIAQATGARVVVMPTSVGAEGTITTYFDLFDALVHDFSGT